MSDTNENIIVIPEGGIMEVSDGKYTFRELHQQRAIIFAALCNQNAPLAWKSKADEEGVPFEDGTFFVGIDLPEGPAIFSFDVDPYWDLFKVREFTQTPFQPRAIDANDHAHEDLNAVLAKVFNFGSSNQST